MYELEKYQNTRENTEWQRVLFTFRFASILAHCDRHYVELDLDLSMESRSSAYFDFWLLPFWQKYTFDKENEIVKVQYDCDFETIPDLCVHVWTA